VNSVAAILYAVSAAVMAALALGFHEGALTPRVAQIALAIGAAVGGFALWAARKNRVPLAKPHGWGWVPVVLFALFAARAFLWLIFRDVDELRVLSPNNIGDMSLHITFINYFANGAPLWPDSPIFSEGKLTYAAGVDIFNSLLVLVGVDIVRGLIWVGLVGAILSGIALWRWGGSFTMMGFLCNGGLLGFACIGLWGTQPIFRDYAGYMNFDWAWKSLPLALLVTQRGFLFALPAGLLLLCSWRSRWFGGGDAWRLPFVGELLLYATMPIFHMHTFIALSLMLGAFFVCHAASRLKLLGFVGAAFVPATLLVWLSVGMFQTNAEPMWGNMTDIENPPPRPPAEVLGWQPGWMIDERLSHSDSWNQLTNNAPEPAAPGERFAIFWLGNFGILPFLIAALALVLLRLVTGRNIPAGAAWTAVFAFGILTPLLSFSTGYQEESFSNFFLGTTLTQNIAVGIVAAIGFIAAIFLQKHNTRDFGIRWILMGFGVLFVVDALFVAGNAIDPRIPLLRANAVPLLAAIAIFVAVLIHLARRWNPPLWPAVFVFPALFLFFLCCNVKFAPWAWDNTKVMIWAYLIVLPFVWEHVLARWPLWARAIVLELLFFTGFLTLLGGLDGKHKGYEIARLSELDAVTVAVKEIPIVETFAAAPTYNHPLLLCGRKTLLGFPGHLGSHGISYQNHEKRLDALMNGSLDWRIIAAEHSIRYLFWGSLEKAKYPDSTEAWRYGAEVIASGDWGEIFDLEMPPIPATP
jgi:hypothetical protein